MALQWPLSCSLVMVCSRTQSGSQVGVTNIILGAFHHYHDHKHLPRLPHVIPKKLLYGNSINLHLGCTRFDSRPQWRPFSFRLYEVTSIIISTNAGP
jgi:hypothetical protein